MIYTVTLNPSLDRTFYLGNLQLGEVNRAERVHTNLGGKGINVSQALANLGLPSILMGLAGGITGQALNDELEKRGFSCAFTRIDGETRSNVTVVERNQQQTTKLNEPGPKVSTIDLHGLESQLASSLQTGDLVILSGSLPPGVPADTYAELIHLVKSYNAFSALDTSGEALRLGCLAQPDWLKPNCEEARSLAEMEVNRTSWLAVLDRIRAFGVQYVLLSVGEQGIIFTGQEHTWHALPPQIAVNSTVGAGDAAFSGALYAWHSDKDEEEISRWAAAAGTAAAALDGSDMPSSNQVYDAYLQTRTELLN